MRPPEPARTPEENYWHADREARRDGGKLPADAWIPGLAGDLPVRQIQRSAVRAVCLPPEPEWSLGSLREGHRKLAQLAAAQGLQLLESPLVALLADPAHSERAGWRWQQLLPVRGRLRDADLGPGISMQRTFGGLYLETRASGGPDKLALLYQHLFGHYLPRYKHELTRPCIYHRILDGLDGRSAAGLTISVLVPVVLSIESRG